MGARLSRYAIHNAISPGGDSDTLAAITGSIAEAACGIPQWFKDKAWPYFDEPLRDICNEVSGLKVQTNGQPILHRLAAVYSTSSSSLCFKSRIFRSAFL